MNEPEFQIVTETVVLTHDIHGNPVVNSRGEPFDPPVTIERTRVVWKGEVPR